MRSLPSLPATIHIIGIAGIGMSAIAQLCVRLGYDVQGSDLDISKFPTGKIQHVSMCNGHEEANLYRWKKVPTCVIVSSIIKDDNPELLEAIRNNIPVIKRAEALSWLLRDTFNIAISGTSGKTTTTSITGELFLKHNIPCTVISGGIMKAYGTNCIIGEYPSVRYPVVVEADESDGTFTAISRNIAMCTTIVPEHMEFFKSIEAFEKAYCDFLNNGKDDICAVVCGDIDENTCSNRVINNSKNIILYGLDESRNHVYASNLVVGEYTVFDIYIKKTLHHSLKSDIEIKGVKLSLLGKHNVKNFLCAVCGLMMYQIKTVGSIDIAYDVIRDCFQDFRGVESRMDALGKLFDRYDNEIYVFSDYAHHYKEIECTANSFIEYCRTCRQDCSIIIVIELHKYSRLTANFEQYLDVLSAMKADKVILMEIYECWENAKDYPVTSSNAHVAKVVNERRGEDFIIVLKKNELLKDVILEQEKGKKMVICMGAGKMRKCAEALIK
ncbi:UDP-N-acetylmuramate--L-alanine ligase [Candidatus Fokinia solitaria]|uniref:UDP-N-acetylmuramate--L-alanine ligase n=1 Tax=Candidatus Fokinia solitaria TaxID=1802984 RepID=A0A2U8BRT8_9RICK|nr:Mur ligase family protein [Candidatus Fokinia solitaria]AWD33066.1 UDP-N-acetylmuramate--L-alanine ligase [Candidatus Fokinia solitaria]